VTTLLGRRRPVSEPEQPHRNALPRGLPGSAIVWIMPRGRKVVPAQWRARHAPVSGVTACFHLETFGLKRRQVMALTSSKSWMAELACEASMAPVPSRRRR